MSICSRLCSTSVRYRTDDERTFLLTALTHASVTAEGPICEFEEWTNGRRLFLYLNDDRNLTRLIGLMTTFHHRFQIETPWTITGHTHVLDPSTSNTPELSPHVYYCIPQQTRNPRTTRPPRPSNPALDTPTRWQIQQQFDHEPVYLMDGDTEVAALPAGPQRDQHARLFQHAQTLLTVLKNVLHAMETPGDYTDIERQALMDDVLSAICSCDPAFSPQTTTEDS